MPDRIEAMAQRAKGIKGMPHHVQISAMRTYIKNTPEEDIIQEIRRLTDQKLFGTFLEVGLNRVLQAELSARWLELEYRS